MKISLIICTRNRAGQLGRCLAKLNEVRSPESPVEVVLVDSASTDETPRVIREFIETSKWKSKTERAERPGLGYARNRGIAASTGELIVFTDDDCYLEENYFQNLLDNFDPSFCQYGMGQVLLYDADDDPRIANIRIESAILLPPRSAVIPAGAVQGANMFFLREVFDGAGFFNEDMGAGTRFPCEDIEMACRASHAGYSGALLPGFTVYHHHGRKKDSPEALKTLQSYDYGRGAYYASLLARGVPQAWKFWSETFSKDGRIASIGHLSQLSREMVGASQYFEFLAGKLK
jgi:glycosyltransferase involved in cell wall biosynthesis